MGLAVANAAKHKLAGLLAERLPPDGVYVGEVIVAGLVKGTASDRGNATIASSIVADKFWSSTRSAKQSRRSSAEHQSRSHRPETDLHRLDVRDTGGDSTHPAANCDQSINAGLRRPCVSDCEQGGWSRVPKGGDSAGREPSRSTPHGRWFHLYV